MSFKIAINGFGRIGRVALRILEKRRLMGLTKAQVVGINDLTPLSDLAYLLKYDSVHGRFAGEVYEKGQNLLVNGQEIKISSIKEPEKLPWKDLGVDVVLESSGVFVSAEKAGLHLNAGAKKVLISAPAKGDIDATICYGVNHDKYKDNMKIISTASCTTNCIAPVAKVINEKFTIKKAFVTTVHSYTNDQKLLDLAHGDKRRSRAAALSMIPTTTGAAQAMSLVMPELEGKFQGSSIRVPTPNVSLIDMVCLIEKNTNVDEINKCFKEASNTYLKGILDYVDEPIVSVDMNGTDCSSIIDGLSTSVIDTNFIKILSWYDNEWGFTNRAVDLLLLMA